MSQEDFELKFRLLFSLKSLTLRQQIARFYDLHENVTM